MSQQESFEEEILRKARERILKDLEFQFGYTHYDWMYRLTREEKYLEEQKEYVRKYEAGKTTGSL